MLTVEIILKINKYKQKYIKMDLTKFRIVNKSVWDIT